MVEFQFYTLLFNKTGHFVPVSATFRWLDFDFFVLFRFVCFRFYDPIRLFHFLQTKQTQLAGRLKYPGNPCVV